MNIKSLLSALFALLLILSIPMVKADAASFKDVNKDFWALDDINRFVEQGIIQGYSNDTFRPQNNVTRAQAAIMLARGLKLDTKNVSTVDYQDIENDHYAYKEIAAVTKAGIMSGSKGKFEPNKPLTRAQMAVILTNAFDLKGNGTASFKDVEKDYYAYQAIDAIYSNDITTGYENNTFKPSSPTSRAHFVVFFSRAIDYSGVESDDEMKQLLKEVYTKEQQLNSYAFEGSMNLGLTLPKSVGEETPEVAAWLAMFKDIQVDISGTYQKDPMLFEANIDLTLKGPIQTTFSVPMVMTQEKMWIKMPQSPLLPLPAELNGKFIEMDFAELAQVSGQPNNASFDVELQTKFAEAISNLVVEHFGGTFYKEVSKDTIKIPEGTQVEKVVKFELTKENLRPFINTVLKDFLPEFINLMEKPEYAKALGIPAEEMAMAKAAFASSNINVDQIVSQINKSVKINEFVQYIGIHPNNYIGYDVTKMDLGVTVEGQTLGLKLTYDLGKTKVNEAATFQIGIPKETDVIPFKKLMELEQNALTETPVN